MRTITLLHLLAKPRPVPPAPPQRRPKWWTVPRMPIGTLHESRPRRRMVTLGEWQRYRHKYPDSRFDPEIISERANRVTR